MERSAENVSASNVGVEADAPGYSVGHYYARNMYPQTGAYLHGKVDGVTGTLGESGKRLPTFVNDFYAAVRADTPKDSKAYELV